MTDASFKKKVKHQFILKLLLLLVLEFLFIFNICPRNLLTVGEQFFILGNEYATP